MEEEEEGRDHALIHIYDPIYAPTTHMGGEERGECCFSNDLSRLPRGLFRRSGGKKEDQGLFHHQWGNRAANYSSFCCLIRVRVSRERKRGKNGGMD